MTTPLFHTTLDELKSYLRLSGVKDPSDSHSIIERAVGDVRSGFYRELGVSTVASLLALTPEDPVTTEEGVLYDVAKSTEVKWARYFLLEALPHAFMDSFGRSQARWNEESPFQDSDQFERAQERTRLMLEIRENLELLKAGSLGSEVTIRINSLGPDAGDTIKPGETAGITWPAVDGTTTQRHQ